MTERSRKGKTEAKNKLAKVPNTIYNVELERKLTTEYNLKLLIQEIGKLEARKNRVSVKTVVDTVRKGFKASLFGCQVDVGLCDHHGRYMEFYGDRNYVRKAFRGDTLGFKALERREVVVEMDSNKNVVVFVPLLGPSTGHGVLEIHGLLPMNLPADQAYFQRPVELVKTMLGRKDYSFVHQTRFWKKEVISPFGGIKQKNSYMVIAGKIKEIVYTKNGVPFYGGPRFTIGWEDGKEDAELPALELLKVYKETPQSLGACTSLDAFLTERLTTIGTLIGHLLESRKVNIFLYELRVKLQRQQVNIVGMIELALQSIPMILHGIREISLVGWKSDGQELKTLVNYYMNLMPSSSNSRASTASSLSRNTLIGALPSSSEAIPNNANFDFNTIIFTQEMTTIQSNDSDLIHNDQYNTQWIGTELIVPSDFLWNKSIAYQRYFVVIHKKKIFSETVATIDIDIIHGVIREIEDFMKRIWKMEQRRRFCREFIKVLEGKLFEWRHVSVKEMCYNIMTTIPIDLLQAHMYVGMLGQLGQDLQYIIANPGSKMMGNKLTRGPKGVSFDVVDTMKTLIVNRKDVEGKKALLTKGTMVDVFYGPSLYKAVIVKDHGHELFDVRYLIDNTIETAVEMKRIIPMNLIFRIQSFNNNARLPFVCIPIRHRNKILGVLGIDHISKQSFLPSYTNNKAGDNSSEEIDNDLQVFLEQLGRILGNAIDNKHKKQILQSLYVIVKNIHVGISDVIKCFLDIIFGLSCFIQGAVVCHLETVAPSSTFSTAGSKGNKSTLGSTLLKPSSSTNGKPLPPKAKILKIVNTRGEIPYEVNQKIKSFQYEKFGKRHIQRSGNKAIWLICHIQTEIDVEVYVFILAYNQPIQDVDYEYFETLQKTLTTLLQTILSNKASGEFRYEALKDIKQVCHQHYLLNKQRHYQLLQSSRQGFFHQVCDIIASCYHSASVYIGILGKFTNEINYVLASVQSQMYGKRLIRSENKGVSFMAIDENKAVCVTAASVLSHRLRHFASRQNFEYPFVVVPLLAGIDTMIGILATDNCGGEQVVDNVEQLEDVISFFTTVSIYIGNILQQYRVMDTKEELRMIVRQSSSFEEGFPKLKSSLLSYLPFATRVLDLTFHPHVHYAKSRVLDSQADHSAASNHHGDGGDHVSSSISSFFKTHLTNDMILVLCVSEVSMCCEDLFTVEDDVKLKISYHGHVYQHLPVVLSSSSVSQQKVAKTKKGLSTKQSKKKQVSIQSTAKVQPILIPLQKGANMEKIRIQCSLTSHRDGLDKEFAHIVLPLHYFLHTSLAKQEHYFHHLPSKASHGQQRIAKMQVSSKLYLASQLVGYYFNMLQVLTKVDADAEHHRTDTNMYAVVKWNDQLLGKTMPQDVTASINWSDLHSFLPINNHIDLKQNKLVIDLYCFSTSITANRNKEYFMGSMEVHGLDLFVHFPHHLLGDIDSALVQKPSEDAIIWCKVDIENSLTECPTWIREISLAFHGIQVPCSSKLMTKSHWLRILRLRKVAIDGEADDDENEDGSSKKKSKLMTLEKQKSTKLNQQYIPVELTVLAARDLFIPKVLQEALPHLDTFVVAVFNGEEVGTTSIITQTESPEWREEHFKVMLPTANSGNLKEDLEGSVLLLELYAMDDVNNRQFKINSLSIEGAALATLFLNKASKPIWFDLEYELNPLQQAPEKIQDYVDNFRLPVHVVEDKATMLTSQILLSGRPITSHTSLSTHIQAEEKGYLELEVQSISNAFDLVHSIDHDSEGSISIDVVFNDQVILQTTDIAIETSSGGRLEWEHQHIVFRHPAQKTLFQSTLSFQVYHAARSIRTLVISYDFIEAELAKVFSKEGIVTRWCKLPLHQPSQPEVPGMSAVLNLNASSEDEESQIKEEKKPLACDLTIRIGPAHTPDVCEYDDFVIWFDLAVVMGLSLTYKPPNKQNYHYDHRPNIFVMIYWNHVLFSRTEIEENYSTCLWEKERFLLRIPLYYVEDARLGRCHLRVEMHHQPYSETSSRPMPGLQTMKSFHSMKNLKNFKFTQVDEPSVCLGFVELTGQALIDFVDKAGAQKQVGELRWFPLTKPVKDDEDYSPIANANGVIGVVGRSWMKLHACIAPLPHQIELDEHHHRPPIIDTTTDYRLHIVEAKHLANVDAYGSANAYVEVSWMDEILGYTQVITQSMDPVWQHESFILVWNKANKYLTPILVLQLYSVTPGKPKTFLGKMSLPGKKIIEYLAVADVNGTTGDKEFPLEIDYELTEEENAFAQGKLIIRLERINYTQLLHDHQMLQESVLWIHSMLRLPSLDTVNNPPMVYFKVFRQYEREGNEKVELYHYQEVTTHFNPTFRRAFVYLSVPSQDDWTGFCIIIEIYSGLDDSIVGHVVIKEERLKKLLTRLAAKDMMLLKEYSLTIADGHYPSSSESVQSDGNSLTTLSPRSLDELKPKIVLGGGLRTNFEQVERIVILDQNKVMTGNRSGKNKKAVSDVNGDEKTEEESNAVEGKGMEEVKGEEDLEEKFPEEGEEEGEDRFDVDVNINQELVNDLLERDSDDEDGDHHTSDGAILELTISPRESQRLSSAEVFNRKLDRELEAKKMELVVNFLQNKPHSSTAPVGNAITGNADVYVAVQWLDKKEAMGKTQVMKLSLSTTNTTTLDFDCERFLLEKPSGMLLKDCTMVLQLYQKRSFKEDLMIASLTFEKEHFVTFLEVGPPHGNVHTAMEMCVKPATLAPKDPLINAQLSVGVSCQIIPDMKKSPLFNLELASNPKTFLDMDVTVICASNLPKVNKLMGTPCEPYAVISYGYSELGETTVVHESIDPIWITNQTFSFRFPTKFDNLLRSIASPIASSKVSRRKELISKLNDDNDNVLLHPDGIFSVDNLQLYIDFYSSTAKPAVFLGSVEISGRELQQTLSQDACFIRSDQQIYNSTWYTLKTTKRKKLAEQKAVASASQVQLCWTRKSPLPSAAAPPITSPSMSSRSRTASQDNNTLDQEHKEIQVSLLAARDLLLANATSGTAVIGGSGNNSDQKLDVYARVRWNGCLVGSTVVIKSTTAPIWEHESFVIRIPSHMHTKDCLLELELWQSKSPPGSNHLDVLLGVCPIRGQQLDEFLHAKPTAPSNSQQQQHHHHIGQQHPSKWLTLTYASYYPMRIQHPALQRIAEDAQKNGDLKAAANKEVTIVTSIECKCHFIDQDLHHHGINGPVHRYEVKIFHAYDLVKKVDNKAGGGNTNFDCYVVVRWNGREIGRTYSIPKTNSPAWKHQLFPLLIGVDQDIEENILLFELWSKSSSFFSKDELLGSVTLSKESLVEVLQDDDVQRGIRQRFPLQEVDQEHNKKTKKYHYEGELEIGVKLLQDSLLQSTTNDELAQTTTMTIHEVENEMKLTWLELLDHDAGKPMIEFTVLGTQILMQAPGSSTFATPQSIEALAQQNTGAASQLGGSVASSVIFGQYGGTATATSYQSQSSNLAQGLLNKFQKSTKSQDTVERSNQPRTTGGASSSIIQPSCTVQWNQEEILHLPPVPLREDDNTASWDVNANAPTTSNGEDTGELERNPYTCYISCPTHSHQIHQSQLIIELWNQDDFQSPLGYFGGICLSFETLLRLYCGQFTFYLSNNIDEKLLQDLHQQHVVVNPQLWKASVTFSLKFVYPFWDSQVSLIPTTYKRRVLILGATNLPLINGEAPNTKCIVYMNGVVMQKSMLITSNTHPSYPRVALDLMLDIHNSVTISVEIMHVNLKTRKEIIVGTEEVAFEYLLRPPSHTMDIFLGPPKDGAAAERQKNSEYKFALSGCVRVLILGNNRLEEDFSPFLSPTHQIIDTSKKANNVMVLHPDGDLNASVIESDDSTIPKLSADEVLWSGVEVHYNHEEADVTGHDKYKIKEIDWLGGVTSLSNVQENNAYSQYLVLPVHDIGIVVGHDVIHEEERRMQSGILAKLSENKDNPRVEAEPHQQHSGSGFYRHLTYGTTPGHRMVMVLERSLQHLSVSDRRILDEVIAAFSAAVVELRWKDLQHKLREIASHCFEILVKDFQRKSKQSQLVAGSVSTSGGYTTGTLRQMLIFFKHVIGLIYPNITFRIVTISQDYETLYYETFDYQNYFLEEGKRRFLPSHYGHDYAAFGKQYHKCKVLHRWHDLTQADSLASGGNNSPTGRNTLFFQSLLHSTLPQYSVMLTCEDCTLAMVQIEHMNFDETKVLLPTPTITPGSRTGGGAGAGAISSNASVASASIASMGTAPSNASASHQGDDSSTVRADSILSADSQLTILGTPVLSKDMTELKKWLEGIGEQCGTVLYTYLENVVLQRLSDYLTLYTSHFDGLLYVILEETIGTLHGCKLGEIISVEPDYKLYSRMAIQATSSTMTTNLLYSHQVSITQLSIHISDAIIMAAHEQQQSMFQGDDDDSQSVLSKDSSSYSVSTTSASVNKVWKNVKSIFNNNNPASGAPVAKKGRVNFAIDEEDGDDVSRLDDLPEDESTSISKSGITSPKLGGIRSPGLTSPGVLSPRILSPRDESSSGFGVRLNKELMEEVRIIMRQKRFLLSIKYDDMEIVEPLIYRPTTDDLGFESNRELSFFIKGTQLMANASDANAKAGASALVCMSIYEVDDYLQLIHENVASLHQISSMLLHLQHGSASNHGKREESQHIKTILHPRTPKNTATFHAMYSLSITQTSGSGVGSVNVGDSNAGKKQTGGNQASKLPSVKGFKLHILRAQQLKAMKNNTAPSVFCEVYYQNKMIHSTKVVKHNTSPVYDDQIYIPHSAINPVASAGIMSTKNTHPANTLVIDLYDMTFLSKGNFFGRVELSYDQLLLNNRSDSAADGLGKEYSLIMRKDMNPKKQAYVGGSLFLEIEADVAGDEKMGTDADGKKGKESGLEEDVNHWHRVQQMIKPSMALTIHSAKDLMAANRFGGGSDPFVIVYATYPGANSASSSNGSEDSEDPVARTKFISDTLNPIWDETFTVPVLSTSNMTNAEAGASHVKKREKFLELNDMPTFRCELYDYNQFTSSTFLGMCLLTPEMYLNQNEITVNLVDKKASSTTTTSASSSAAGSKSTAVKNKSSLLPQLQGQKIKGSISFQWLFTDEQDNHPLTTTADAVKSVLPRWLFNIHKGLLQYDCITIKIMQIKDIVKSKKSILSNACNPYIVLKYLPTILTNESSALPKITEDAESEKMAGTSERFSAKRSAVKVKDPYTIGQTKRKKNTLSPVYNETFAVNVTLESIRLHKMLPQEFNSMYPNLLCEVWHKDDFFGNVEFIGEVILRPEDYLHPSVSISVDEKGVVKSSPLAMTYVMKPNKNKSTVKDHEFEDNLGSMMIQLTHQKTSQKVDLHRHNFEMYHRYGHSTGKEIDTVSLSNDENNKAAASSTALVKSATGTATPGTGKEKNSAAFKSFAASNTFNNSEGDKSKYYLPTDEFLFANSAVIPLRMTYDPTLESNRQQQEHSSFPTLVSKSQSLIETYINHPFLRTGLISEGHYGQICAAARRAEKTILRTTVADMICIPLFQKKSLTAAGSNSSNTTTGTSNGTATSGNQANASSVVSNAAGSTAGHALSSYLVCRFPSNTISRRDMKFLEKVQQHVISNANNILYARQQRLFALQQLHQNITLLHTLTNSSQHSNQSMTSSVSDVLLQSLLDFEISLNCPTKCYLLHDDGQHFFPVSMDTGRVMVPQASVSVPSSIPTTPASTKNQYGASSKFNFSSKTNNTFGSTSNSVNAALQAQQAQELVQDLAAIVRHDIMIQLYKGEVSFLKTAWHNIPFLQVDLPTNKIASSNPFLKNGMMKGSAKKKSFQSVKNMTNTVFTQTAISTICEEIDALNEDRDAKIMSNEGFCMDVLKRLSQAYPEGCFVIPVMSYQEVLVGVMILKNINQIPNAVYEYYLDQKDTIADAAVGSTKNQTSNAASIGIRSELAYDEDEDTLALQKQSRPILKRIAMEHGVVQNLLKSSVLFSEALCGARLLNAYKTIKSFSVKADTCPLYVIRYAFRMLAQAIPAIRHVTLWAVHVPHRIGTGNRPTGGVRNMTPLVQSDSTSSRNTARSNNDTPHRPSLLQRMFTFGSSQKTVANSVPARSSITSPENSARYSSASSSKHPAAINFTRLACGCFGDEDPTTLLKAPMERNAVDSKASSNTRRVAIMKKSDPSTKGNATTNLAALASPATINPDEIAAWKLSELSLESLVADANDEDNKAEVQNESVDLAYREIVRSIEVNNMKSFVIHTGHTLAIIGGDTTVPQDTPKPTGDDSLEDLSQTTSPTPNKSLNPDKINSSKDMLMSTVFNPRYVPYSGELVSKVAGPLNTIGPNPSARTPTTPGTNVSSRTPAATPLGGAVNRAPPLPPGPIPISKANAPGSSRSFSSKGSESPRTGTVPRRNGLLPRPNNGGMVTTSASSSRSRRTAFINEAQEKQKPSYIMISVNTHGVGGNTGWGYIGPQLQNAVETVATLLEVNLVKLARLRAQALVAKRAKEAEQEEADAAAEAANEAADEAAGEGEESSESQSESNNSEEEEENEENEP